MRIISNDINIPFLKYRWIAVAISSVVVVAALVNIIRGHALNLGIDFSGGTQVTVKFDDVPNLQQLRDQVAGLGFGEPVVQRFDEEEKQEVLIRLGNPQGEEGDFTRPILDLLAREYNADIGDRFDLNTQGSRELAEVLAEADPAGIGGDVESRRLVYEGEAEAVMDYRKLQGMYRSVDELETIDELSPEVLQYLKEQTAAGSFALLGAENVGPSVGADLRDKAQLAIIGSMIGMLLYISFRFQLPYGLGALAAIFHDVLVTVAALDLTQREINLPTIAAILTLVGYSVNDTVVVFDRVRENLKLTRSKDLEGLMNRSINQTLSRTLITSGTTLFVVLALLLFGGDVINTFAFVLVIGVIAGTYSTIFIASPVALGVTNLMAKRRAAKAKARR